MLKDEMKKTLENQILEKKQKELIQKEKDRIYLDKMKENDDAFKSEKENKQKTEKEKVLIYQNDLRKQLGEKKNKNTVFMDEIEKTLNKEIIKNINI
jgi:hypothetical protein